MICMISKVNLGVGEMRLMFCDLYVSIKNIISSGDINSTKLPCMTLVLPGDASNLRYFT